MNKILSLLLLIFIVMLKAENNTTKPSLTLEFKIKHNTTYTKSIKNVQMQDENGTNEIKQNGKTFYLPKSIFKYDELIKLILATESMDDDERQYWFDIMPRMTDKQINRLYDILDTERQKLQALEIKYQEEIKALNEKHLIEWREFLIKKKQEFETNTSTEEKYKKMIDEIKKIREGD